MCYCVIEGLVNASRSSRLDWEMLLTTTASGCNVGGVGFVVFIFGFLASPAEVRHGWLRQKAQSFCLAGVLP